MYQIDKGVPIPEKHAQAKVYPFSQMLVGDSFSAPISAKARVVAAVSKYETAHKTEGIKFTRRKIDDQTIRVWRIA